MSKKIMVLALAVVSAAFFALPAMASAQEIHLEPAENFTISGPTGGELRAEGEPTITCTKTEGKGKFDAGSTTTGVVELLDFTGCHTAVFGFTASCKTEGAVAGTIKNEGTFHLITWKESTGTVDAAQPAVLLTPKTTTIICAGISTVVVHGNVIGTITKPTCGGAASNELTLSFTATGNVQTHNMYTGVVQDLTATTGEGGAARTAALVGHATNTQANAAKLNCT